MKNVTLLLTLFIMTSCTNLIKRFIDQLIDKKRELEFRINVIVTILTLFIEEARAQEVEIEAPIKNPVTFSRPDARSIENLPPKTEESIEVEIVVIKQMTY